MAQIQYDFGSGRADPGTFPTKRLQEAAVKVIGEQAEELTKYPGDLGHLGMRQAMARREEEREGVSINPDHILLTNGSMQAVTLAAEALQEMPGDSVILEEFNYPGTLSAYRSLKLDMVGIKLDEGGMRIDHMEDELKRLDKQNRAESVSLETHFSRERQISNDRKTFLVMAGDLFLKFTYS